MNDPLLLVAMALLLDHWLGEPARFHPLVGFGWLVNRMEFMGYGPGDVAPVMRMLRGGIATLLLVVPIVALTVFLQNGPATLQALLAVILLYLAVGMRSLAVHALAVAVALEQGDQDEAKRRVAMLVSRDVENLDASGVARAATESVLENGCDAVFGAIFWFLVLGAPGVVLYRLANTLDAMWGYRSSRYLYFGRFAARLDDLLNFLPARLTVLTYALLGQTRPALRAWWQQGRCWYSPNAGPVMAAGAGALGVRLGGPAIYHGELKQRPVLGEGQTPQPADIRAAVRLVRSGAWGWALLGVILWGMGHA